MPAGQLLRRPPVLAALATLVVVALIWGGTCTAPDGRSLPAPSSTSSTEATTTTSTIDLSRVVLERVPGETTTTLVGTGSAVLQGVVVGPEGEVAGATVRVERLVGDAVQAHEAQAGADGTFVIPGLPGGRMRVRAFLPPTLTMTDPEIFFQADGETRDLRLQLREHQGTDVRASTAPRAPVAGDLVSVAVRVAERVVDDRGLATTRPLAGVAVGMRSTGWTPVGSASADDDDDDDDDDSIFDDDDFDDDSDSDFDDEDFDRTDASEVTDVDGVAVFTFRCERAGTVTATVEVSAGDGGQSVPLEVPPCGSRPTTTTTTEPTSTPTTAAATTTTEDG